MISPTRVLGHGRVSGADIDLEMTAIWRIRGALAVWGATFLNRSDALETIGASEDELELVE